MAHLMETVTQHIMCFEDDEITVIINALHATGSSELADEIFAELYGEEEECDSCNKVKVELTGDEWLKDLAEDIIDEIYQYSLDGRVIIRR